MTHVTIQEAARLCELSPSWVRKQTSKLSREARALKDENGHWKIEREAILVLAGELKGAKHTRASSSTSEESSVRSEMIALMESQMGRFEKLLEDSQKRVRELEEENRALRTELSSLLRGEGKGKLSRFFRAVFD